MKLPEKTPSTLWLFPDMVRNGATLEFSSFNPEYVSKNNKKFPVLVFVGEVKYEKDGNEKIQAGEFMTSYWNIDVQEIIDKKGDDPDTWGAIKCDIILDPDNDMKMKVTRFKE